MDVSAFLHALSKLTHEDLDGIKGIGPVLAENVTTFTSSKRFHILQEAFTTLEKQDSGLHISQVSKKSESQLTGALVGESICITGSFDIPRPQIKEKLEAIGAKVVDAVSKKTTILVAGEKAGSKLQKAEKLGVRVVTDYNELLV